MNRRRCEIHNSPAEKRKGKAYRQHGSNLRFSVHRVTFMGSPRVMEEGADRRRLWRGTASGAQ